MQSSHSNPGPIIQGSASRVSIDLKCPWWGVSLVFLDGKPPKGRLGELPLNQIPGLRNAAENSTVTEKS